MGAKDSKTELNTLTKEKIKLLTNDNVFTEDQIKLWFENFIRDCPDGRLNQNKLMMVLKQFYATETAKSLACTIFQTFDVFDCGYIGFVEFMTAINLISKLKAESKLGLAFNLYAQGKFGMINRIEACTILRKVLNILEARCNVGENKMTDDELEKLFRNAFHDRKFTKKEFIQACLNDIRLRTIMECAIKS